MKLYPFDWIIIGYSLLMMTLVLFLGRPVSEYRGEVIFYASMAAIAALIIRYVDERKNGLLRFIRLIYPGILYTFFYTATGGTMFLLFDTFFDKQLTSFEASLFGVNPTIYIDMNLLNVWLTEIISACYFAYYLMIPGFFIGLFIKKDDEMIKRGATAISLTFFIGYMLFFLFPIEGPRYFFAGEYVNEVSGPIFRQAVEFVIANGAVRGGCMPSTHFAVALVIMIYLLKKYRKLGLVMIPINMGLAIGTVWGRFHYVSDVFIGGLIGLFATVFVERYYDIWLNREKRVKQFRNEMSQRAS